MPKASIPVTRSAKESNCPMPANNEAKKIRVAIIGAGAVSDYHHVPALRLDPRAELVAVCDAAPALLEKRKGDWGVAHVTTDPEALCREDFVDAVIIATPNFTHKPIAIAAAKAG